MFGCQSQVPGGQVVPAVSLKELPDPGRLPSSLEGIPPKDRLAVHNDQMLVGLVASHDGADHGLDRPRATPWGAGQSERDVARNPLVVCRARIHSARHLICFSCRVRLFAPSPWTPSASFPAQADAVRICFLLFGRSRRIRGAASSCNDTRTSLPAAGFSATSWPVMIR